jgi:hypothetical protein
MFNVTIPPAAVNRPTSHFAAFLIFIQFLLVNTQLFTRSTQIALTSMFAALHCDPEICP